MENHNKHDVVPVKQQYEEIVAKVERAKRCQQRIEENTRKLLDVKDQLDRNKEEMRNRVTTRVREYQEMLAELADEVLSAIEVKTNEELKKATAETDLLLILQEELKTVDIGLFKALFLGGCVPMLVLPHHVVWQLIIELRTFSNKNLRLKTCPHCKTLIAMYEIRKS